MGLVREVYQFSMLAFFMRVGDAFTLPAPGVAGRDSKPDGADPAYIDIGTVEEWEPDFGGGTDQEVWRPNPGVLQLHDVRETKAKLTIKWTVGQVSPLILESFYRTSQNLDEASAQFSPGFGALRRGWLHFDCYDQDTNDFRLSFDLFGRLKVTGGMKTGDGTIVKPTCELLVLSSDSNTAGL